MTNSIDAGLEVVTASLELSGPEASRRYIEAAHPSGRPTHPSLLDPTHQLDALFGVVNIPNVIWIDESGIIVRPPEPGWPGGRQDLPKEMLESMPDLGRAPGAPPEPDDGPGMWAVLGSGQDRSDVSRRDPRLGGQGCRRASSSCRPTT